MNPDITILYFSLFTFLTIDQLTSLYYNRLYLDTVCAEEAMRMFKLQSKYINVIPSGLFTDKSLPPNTLFWAKSNLKVVELGDGRLFIPGEQGNDCCQMAPTPQNTMILDPIDPSSAHCML